MKNRLTTAVRLLLTCVLLYFVFEETGVATTLVLGLVALDTEVSRLH